MKMTVSKRIMYKNRSFKRRGEDKTEIIEVISKVRQISDLNKGFQAFLKTFEIASERKNYTKYLRTKITIPSVNAAKTVNLSNFLIFKRLACVFFRHDPACVVFDMRPETFPFFL